MTDTIELTVDKIVPGGDGIGRSGGMVVFVPQTAPGDRLKVRIHTRKRSYWQGTVEEIIEPSPLRTRPACPYYGVCGGCDLQHLSYDSQLVVKKLILNDALQRIGRVFVPPSNPLPAESPWRYRNKSQYPASGPPWRIGFFQRRSHRIVDISQCLVQPEVLDHLRSAVKLRLEESSETSYDETTRAGNIRHVVVKYSRATGQACLMFVTAGTELTPSAYSGLTNQHPELASIVHNVNPDPVNRIAGSAFRTLAGKPFYHERVLGLTLQVSSASFFQANTSATELLVKRILKYLEPDGTEQVLDLYCGVGTITVPIAGFVRGVIGVEANPSAVNDARANLEQDGVRNAEIRHAAVEDAIAQIDSTDAVVLDPPRKGCEAGVVRELGRLKPRIIVYVSCNPTTLARDIARLQLVGYSVEEIQPLDMFPQTSHIETIVKLVQTANRETA